MLPEIITKARERLLVRARFLGSIALWLHWIEAPEVGTMATDGRHVWFCRRWCESQGVRKTMGVIAHEVLHVVNRHHLRRGGRNPQLWNIAADLVINRLLSEDKYEVPEDGLFDHERRFTGLAVEAVYLRLEQTQQSLRQPPDEANQQTQQGGTGTSRPNATTTSVGSSTSVHDKGTSRTPDSDRSKVAAAKRWGEVRDLTHESGKQLSAAELHQAEGDLDVVIRQAAAAAKRAGQCPFSPRCKPKTGQAASTPKRPNPATAKKCSTMRGTSVVDSRRTTIFRFNPYSKALTRACLEGNLAIFSSLLKSDSRVTQD